VGSSISCITRVFSHALLASQQWHADVCCCWGWVMLFSLKNSVFFLVPATVRLLNPLTNSVPILVSGIALPVVRFRLLR